MSLPWPSIQAGSSQISADEEGEVKALLDSWAGYVAEELTRAGMPRFAAPIFQPWNICVVVNDEVVHAVFGKLTGGLARVIWADGRGQPEGLGPVINTTRDQLGWEVVGGVTLRRAARAADIRKSAAKYAENVVTARQVDSVVDLGVAPHLQPHIRSFLDDHPNPRRTAFVMMRFSGTEHHQQIIDTVRASANALGVDAVRADDRDYTGDLWTNVELCMQCSALGIAILEDIDERDFNPNVSLELGYMLGSGKRCLILKEQRLPAVPADVVHRLYKEFDIFAIEVSVTEQVRRWLTIDLRLGTA